MSERAYATRLTRRMGATAKPWASIALAASFASLPTAATPFRTTNCGVFVVAISSHVLRQGSMSRERTRRGMSWREKVTLLICSRLGYIISKQDGEVPKMAKTEMIRARVEPELKSQAEEVFSGLGLSPTAAITLFYRQVTLHHGLPFAVKVPNAETIAALRQARTGEGLTEYTSLEDLKARHG